MSSGKQSWYRNFTRWRSRHHGAPSEDESRIVVSTPTAKPMPLLPPEATTTPASEPPTDLLRRPFPTTQEIETRPESPLASPPLTPPVSDPQPMFSLQTPPRRPQFHTPKTEFETPPPPRGMPDLPGPPSSDEEEVRTPLTRNGDIPADLTSLKTPRPPGAWLATPAPTRLSTKEPLERAGSAPLTEANSSNSDGGLATPPSTLSRNNTMSAPTPAPPGGWVATPAPPATAGKRELTAK